MHSAPAVRYPVARSPSGAAALWGLWLFAASVCAWWAWLGAEALRLAVAVAALGVSGLCAWLQWRAAPTGFLRWDTRAWWWQSGDSETPVTVQIRIDFQRGLLLQLGGHAGNVPWCYVERATLPARWGELRCALYAAPATSANGPVASASSAP